MKIDPSLNIASGSAVVGARLPKQGQPRPPEAEGVKLSGQATNIKQLTQELKTTPPVRADVVAQTRSELGNLGKHAAAAAESLLAELKF